MKSRCPECGGTGQEGAIAVSGMSGWFTCVSCHSVWRGSLIGTAFRSVMQGAVLRGAYRKVVHGYKSGTAVQTETVVALCEGVSAATPPSDPEISHDLGHLEQALAASGHGIGRFEDGINSDEVSEWLGEEEAQIQTTRATTFDEQIAQLDGPVSTKTLRLIRPEQERIEEEFFAAFGDESLEPLRAASDGKVAAYVEARVSTPAIEEFESFAEEAAEEAEEEEPNSPLTSSCDRALKNVDGMHDAFVRLQEQLAGIERWCDKLIDAKPEEAPHVDVHAVSRYSRPTIQPYRIIQPF